MNVTAFDLAQRYVGMREVSGVMDNPIIVGMLRLDAHYPEHDEVPWCSAFVNYIAWLLRLPRSKSLSARSWLAVGTPIALEQASVGFDVVVLNRANGDPNPDNLKAPGHVGFFAGRDGAHVTLLGGNQGDSVSLARFPRAQILGVRQLA